MGLLDSDTPSYNVGAQVGLINSSKNTQQQLAEDNYKRLGALNKPFQESTTAIGQQYADKGNGLNADYLKNVGSAGDQLGTSLSQALTRNTMAAQPALQNSLREQLAGSGGLQRGAYDQGVMQLGQQAANNIYEGNQSIANQQLQNRTNALGNVYNNQTGMNSALMGNDLGANSSIYNNNRADTSNFGNTNLGIEQNSTNDLLSALNTGQNANLAAQSAQNSQNSALLGGLLQAGGTAAGAYFGGPMGAAAGSQFGKSLATSTGPRGTVQSA